MTDCNLEFARGGAEFTVDLYEKLKAGTRGENLIVSPFSIQTCMALVFAGAKGVTANEIATALKYKSESCTEVAKTFQFVLDQYKDSGLLKIANKIYVLQGCNINADYGAIVQEQLHAEVEPIDFAESDLAAKNINSWVSDKTAGKIGKIVEASDLSGHTRLLLLNAIHFKGAWEKKFDTSRTQEDEFWLNENDSIKIKYMNKNSQFLYCRFDNYNCTALEMFFENSDLSMFVLLPQERNGLAALVDKLKNVNLVDLNGEMHMQSVVVKFPKFKINYESGLRNILMEMGVHLAFDNADFSNMLESTEAISISKVFHKACIEVDEKGAEAAAVTAVKKIRNRCLRQPITFTADHPFLYWIWNKKNILFAGTFVNAPNE